MERWRNKVAVVTGSSSGIGSACVIGLARSGMKVVALARREERLKALKNGLPANIQGNVFPMKCDVTNEHEVIKAFQWIDSNLGGVHVLVNNAGVFRKSDLMAKNNTADIRATVETNIMGVVYCVREAYQQMKAHKVAGHIVIVNSITGHSIPVMPVNSLNMYGASKYAVTAMTETYRQEFSNDGTDVKVTSISPGVVDTEILPDEIRQTPNIPMLKSEDISNAIVFCLSTPPHVQIHELIIKPLHEKF